MTEHAAVIFVFFFLAEYASIVLICILTSILFLGGYLYDYIPSLFWLTQYFDFDYYIENLHSESIYSDPLIQGLLSSLRFRCKIMYYDIHFYMGAGLISAYSFRPVNVLLLNCLVANCYCICYTCSLHLVWF